MLARARWAAVAAATALAAACAPIPAPTVMAPAAGPTFEGYASATYGSPSMWLCRPDLPGDRCRVDLTATEVRPDGSRVVVPYVPARDPKVDCFYLYPTVDLDVLPGNHTDFGDTEAMASAAAAQVARFGEVCRVFAPLYRQITIGTYLGDADERDRRLDVAFSDVADAFAHYLGQHNHGRKIALIGHSQGGDMVVRLLRRFFDGSPELRERLLVAMPIGWQVEVRRGERAGGSFTRIPVCARDDELGCVIAFRSHLAGVTVKPGRWAPAPGNETVCVNPASAGASGGGRRLSRAYFPTRGTRVSGLRGLDGIPTPWVLYRDHYAARCADGPDGYRYLAVGTTQGDTREGPIALDAFVWSTAMGLHVLDLQLPQGDLIDAVGRRAAALPPSGPPP